MWPINASTQARTKLVVKMFALNAATILFIGEQVDQFHSESRRVAEFEAH